MIKFVKSIVDTNRNLIGFVAEAKAYEFGGIGDNVVQQAISVANIGRFPNRQLAYVDRRIVEKNGFHIHDLPMCVYITGGMVDVSNKIDIVEKFMRGNNIVGYRVKFGDGSFQVYNYKQLMELTGWFKPNNFMLKVSPNGKSFICGKKGYSVDNIKTTYIGEPPKAPAKRVKTGASEMGDMKPSITNIVDILDIYEFVRARHGYIMRFPNEKYERATKQSSEVDEGFIPLGVGEIADPYIRFSDVKLNATAKFKKMGKVKIQLANTEMDVFTYVYADKSIFLNGENHMKNFGIVVDAQYEPELVNTFVNAMALSKEDNRLIIEPVKALTNNKNIVIYRVDTSKIALLAESKVSSSLMTPEQICEVLKKMYSLSLMSKYLSNRNGVVAELRKKLSPEEYVRATGTQVNALFAALAEAKLVTLQQISEAGVNIYDGSFRKMIAVKKDSESSKEDEINGAGEVDTPSVVEIEYSLAGYVPSKITGNAVKKALNGGDTKGIPGSVIKALTPIETLEDPVEKLSKAYEMLKNIDKSIMELKTKMWMHNCAMYTGGKVEGIHWHDKQDWSVDTKSRVKTGVSYVCIKPGCEGLKVKVKGSQIVQ